MRTSHHISQAASLVLFCYWLIIRAIHTSLLNNAFYIILNSIVTSLLGFIFWNIMARTFSPENVGIGSALIAASGLLAIISTIGLESGLIRFIPKVKNAISLINSTFTIVAILATLISIIYLVGSVYWSPVLKFVLNDVLLLILFILTTMFTALSLLTDQALLAGRSAKFVFYKNLLNSLIKLPLPLVAFSFWGGFGIFVSTGIGLALANIVAWFHFLPIVFKNYSARIFFDVNVIKHVLPFSFANYLANFLNSAPAFVYPLMIINILGPENNAYFYIAWMMTMILRVIPNGISQSLFAEGAHDPQKLAQNGRRALIFALLLSLPASFTMIFLGGWLLSFFGPGYEENGKGIVFYLALGVFPQCINMLYISLNQVKKKVNLIIIQAITVSILSISGGYWLLGINGLNGIAMAYTFAQLVVAAIVICPLLRQLLGKQKGSGHVVN
ncbi:MAG: oligosaccharide flippase family protein [Firmicutes bacterium]|nr:oligosaccharide flippase family protein [Bacillota bacterium]